MAALTLETGMVVSLEGCLEAGARVKMSADIMCLGATFVECGDATQWRSDSEFVVFPGSKFKYHESVLESDRWKRRRGPDGERTWATEDERRLARRRHKDEEEENKARQERVEKGVGSEPLRFGDSVQLKHASSGQWLCEEPLCATTSAECLRVSFSVAEVGAPECVFKLAPAFRAQREGASRGHRRGLRWYFTSRECFAITSWCQERACAARDLEER